MSELKAVHAFDVYEAYTKTGNDDAAQVYLKSEADKVIADLEESHKMEVEQLLIEIAELKNKINEAQTELELWRDGSIISEAHQKELDGKQHSDYKRCVAMAKWCDAEFYKLRRSALKDAFWLRWNERWLAIAEKFKPNSTVQ